MAGASGARRIVLNRQAFDAITLAVADGMFELAKEVATAARPPDATPYGEGLVQGRGVLAFVGHKRIGAWAPGLGPARLVPPTSESGLTHRERMHLVRREQRKARLQLPRQAKLSSGITVIGGFGFPGRFVEQGTVRTHAEPFLTPALMATLPAAENFVKAAAVKHRIISAQRAARGDTFQERVAGQKIAAMIALIANETGGMP